MPSYDLVVVGSGSGLNVAAACADAGLKVAVVESGPLGGTCLNRGCIPSKMLLHAASVAETVRRAREFGIKADYQGADFAGIVRRVTLHVDDEARQIERALRSSSNPRLHKGAGRFVSPRRLKVGSETLTAERFVLAHGARPALPDLAGLETTPFMTSADALRRTDRPERLLVLGGGYIAAEFAHFYEALGTDVTIVHQHERLLPREDETVSTRFTAVMRKRVAFHAGYEARKAWEEDGDVVVRARRPDGTRSRTLRTDALLVATGITPNSDALDVAATGVATDDRGFVEVDDHLETSVPGIYALGDAVGRFPFKHAANHESHIVAHNLLHPERRARVDYTAMPHAVFTSPQVAGAGATEQELRAAGAEYRVARHDYADTAMGHAMRDVHGFVKLLVGPSGRILGCHILGANAATLIHEVLVAMRTGDGTVDAIADTVHIHPALSEVVARAATA